MSRLEITPDPSGASSEELEQFTILRQTVLGFGFDECNVKIPSQGWHGTRVEAHIDDAEELPFIRPRQGENRLSLATLSGIGFDLDTQEQGNEHPLLFASIGGLVIDKEIKLAVIDLAEMAEDLAHKGFGYSNEISWLSPLATDKPLIELAPFNSVRKHRIEKEVEAGFEVRKEFWGELDWHYSPTISIEDRP